MAVTGRILIIDDEPVLRHSLTRILQPIGHAVTTAENGPEGLNLLGQQPFDLVYLDITMPGMSGMDVLKIIHQNFPLVSVVLITARPELNTALQAMREGATDYLLKPLKPQQIIDRTETFLARQANERRKREIESQIKDLQAELLRLESAEADTVETEQKAIHTGERFLIRGSLKLDLHARRLLLGKNTINLPRTTFDYLVVLARHAPKVVDFQTLVAEAQGYQTDAREAQELVKWHIHHIRKAIEPNVSKPRYLTNVRGIGYQLVME